MTSQSLKHVGCQSLNACTSRCLPDICYNRWVFGRLPQQAPIIISKSRGFFSLFSKWVLFLLERSVSNGIETRRLSSQAYLATRCVSSQVHHVTRCVSSQVHHVTRCVSSQVHHVTRQVEYRGDVVSLTEALVGFPAGGQVLLSGSTYQRVYGRLHTVKFDSQLPGQTPHEGQREHDCSFLPPAEVLCAVVCLDHHCLIEHICCGHVMACRLMPAQPCTLCLTAE